MTNFYLHWLRGLTERIDDYERQRAEAVNKLREDNMSWSEIGEALGVTKQAAQQRYGGSNND